MIFSDWPWRHWRQVRGEAIALRLNDEQLNWRELCARVDELASSFAVQGVVEGSGVMLRAWNTPQTLLAWLALLQCGAREPSAAATVALRIAAQSYAAICAGAGRGKHVSGVSVAAHSAG